MITRTQASAQSRTSGGQFGLGKTKVEIRNQKVTPRMEGRPKPEVGVGAGATRLEFCPRDRIAAPQGHGR